MQKTKAATKKTEENNNVAGTEALPSSFKKFRRVPEIESFYRFVYENDLRKEGGYILDKILLRRKLVKAALKKEKSASKRKAASAH